MVTRSSRGRTTTTTRTRRNYEQGFRRLLFAAGTILVVYSIVMALVVIFYA